MYVIRNLWGVGGIFIRHGALFVTYYFVVETAGPHHSLTGSYYINFAFGGGHVRIALTFVRLFTVIIMLQSVLCLYMCM